MVRNGQPELWDRWRIERSRGKSKAPQMNADED
jgi:hypothetical protein